MSCYEWERGTIKLSVAEYARVKKEFYDAYNQALEADFKELERFYTDLCAAIKANTDKAKTAKIIARDLLEGVVKMTAYSSRARYDFKVLSDYQVINALLVKKEDVLNAQGAVVNVKWIDRKSPVTPKKKDFKSLSPSKDLVINDAQWGDATVRFVPDEKSLVWDVSENNRACDHARESFVGRLFFRLLSKVTWTRATGGVIYGQNEYERDSDRNDPFGGGNRTKECYGPIGEAHKKEKYRFR